MLVIFFLKIINHSTTLKNGFYEFQIGSENVLTIKELIGNKTTLLNFGALSYRENEIMDCMVDVSEIKKLGWSVNFSIQEGIKKMVEQELINSKLVV